MVKTAINETLEETPEGMVLVKGGTFLMGSEDEEADVEQKPVHEVNLKDYYIGKFPVTQELWESIMGTNPSNFKGENLPVFVKQASPYSSSSVLLPY